LRGIVGFLPDVTGKDERIKISFQSLSSEIREQVRKRGLNPGACFLITDGKHLAANVVMWLPDMKFLPLKKSPEDISEESDTQTLRYSGPA
jgi:hypothetical protein